MTGATPLILLSNDDGVYSPGLAAAAEALAGLGELLIVAPKSQQTSTGRSYDRRNTTAVSEEWIEVAGCKVRVYAVDGTPAQAVMLALYKIASRRPSLVVAGINYGENLGSGVTISGTVGVCLEGASSFIPGLAVSVETAIEHHYHTVDTVDFTIARHWTRHFARSILACGLPPGVDILKIDVPASATHQTPWRMTRLSRQRYYLPAFPSEAEPPRQNSIGYYINVDRENLEPDSDIYAFVVDRVVSVTPLTTDLTTHTDLGDLARCLA
ncbi:MAG: 5'/3'-nucleotidase SurE [Anaerolineae bacterium]|nr:5'/3'-nucleotidase SurE [Anaerolineae bacterium]